MSVGKLRLIIHQKPDAVWNQQVEVVSVRKEDNSVDVTFSYQHMNAATMTSMQTLYQEGIPGDPSQTYIAIVSQNLQLINSNTSGTVVLHVVSNGTAGQLDKTVNFNIGTNPVTMAINFESRPDTLLLVKSTPNYTIPIQITSADVLNHIYDFDGNAITKVAVDTNGDPNFSYNGAPYVSMEFIPVDTLTSLGFFYTPDNNPLAHTVEYDWYVMDETGLITKL